MTTALLPAPFPSRLARPFVLGALVGSVALDADHLPIYASLRPDHGRTRTHSIAMVGLVAAAACVRGPRRERRRFVWGLSEGLASYLLRDGLTGGAPLLWPWFSRIVGVQLAPQTARRSA